VYGWIWRHAARGDGSAKLLGLHGPAPAGVLLLLFLVVFPAVEPLLPVRRVTVGERDGGAGPS
jgi:hypothetical protein